MTISFLRELLYSWVFYAKGFNFLVYRLVTKINNSIGQDPDSKHIIGVLDIYGFESFKTNRCLTGMPLFSADI